MNPLQNAISAVGDDLNTNMGYVQDFVGHFGYTNISDMSVSTPQLNAGWINAGSISADRISGGTIKAEINLGTDYQFKIGDALFTTTGIAGLTISTSRLMLYDGDIYLGDEDEAIDIYIRGTLLEDYIEEIVESLLSSTE